MNKQSIIKALQQAREKAKKRKFSQRVDLIITLKGLNLKRPDDQVEFFAQLPHGTGKKVSVCAFVGPDLVDEAKKVCDEVITPADFEKYKDKKLLKKLANKHDYFIAQGDLMAKVAATFGRALGPRGKMPNPKAGCVIPPKGAIKPVYEKLQKTAKIVAKKQLAVQLPVGSEEMKDEEIAENILTIYDQLIHHLPQEKNNVKSVYVKLTMGEPVMIQ